MLERIRRPPVFEDEEKTRVAGMLNSMLVATFVIVVLLSLASALFIGRPAIVAAGLAIAVATLVLQPVMRRGHVQLASLLFVGIAFVCVTAIVWLSGNPRAPSVVGYIACFIAAGILVGQAAGAAFLALAVLASFGLFLAETWGWLPPPIRTASHLMDPVTYTALFSIVAMLITLATRSLNAALEQARRSGRDLRDLSDSLEEHVVARTQEAETRSRELSLAVLVGQHISAVRDPDSLLAEAVDLIRSTFGLYYVQVFLADPAGRSLELQAGTGDAGAELLRQGLVLPIDLESLAGSAAAKKQSILVSDAGQITTFVPNPLLPYMHSQLVIPLLVSSRVIGVLDVQATQVGRLTRDNQLAFELIAGHIAFAIDNAHLLAEVSRTRAEVEAQVRRLTREGWQAFLDAIRHSERMGYVYERDRPEAAEGGAAAPLEGGAAAPLEGRAAAHVLTAPIHLHDIPLGAIRIEGQADRAWTEAEAELVQAIAQQVAQQADNLRLMAQANQYRAEAEQATRRLTFEGWQDYLKTQSSSTPGFFYDLDAVKPLTSGVDLGQPASRWELKVRDQAIGQLAIDQAGQLDEHVSELAAAVADRLSAHVENLRLAERTDRALAAAEEQSRRLVLLNQMSERLGHTPDRQAILDVVTETTGQILAADRVSCVVTTEAGEDGFGEFSSFMTAPLLIGNRTFGTLKVGSHRPDHFTERDHTILQQIASLAATAIENRRLFEETQRREQEALQTAERLLELDRLRNEFMANMSHELRTPLNAIIGYSEVTLMGLDGELEPEKKEDVLAIYENGIRLLNMVDDILDLVKIESRRLKLNVEDVDIEALLDDVRTRNVGLLYKSGKPIELDILVEGVLPPVRADRMRLSQIFNNLVSNAIKFTDRGRISVRAFGEAGCVCVRVQDTGIGINQVDMGKIFEKFSQVDGSNRRRAEGTGLGLSIVRSLVQLHGGTIDVQSEMGEGSIFTVRLPLAGPQAAQGEAGE